MIIAFNNDSLISERCVNTKKKHINVFHVINTLTIMFITL